MLALTATGLASGTYIASELGGLWDEPESRPESERMDEAA
jgi:hypothetical protein